MINGTGVNFGFEKFFWPSAFNFSIIWSNPNICQSFLEGLAVAGYGKETLTSLQHLINAEKSDLFQVFKNVVTADPHIPSDGWVARSQSHIFRNLNTKEKESIEFVLSEHIESDVDELSLEKIPDLFKLKYFTLPDAIRLLGEVPVIRELFIGFQKELYGVGRG